MLRGDATLRHDEEVSLPFSPLACPLIRLAAFAGTRIVLCFSLPQTTDTEINDVKEWKSGSMRPHQRLMITRKNSFYALRSEAELIT